MTLSGRVILSEIMLVSGDKNCCSWLCGGNGMDEERRVNALIVDDPSLVIPPVYENRVSMWLNGSTAIKSVVTLTARPAGVLQAP